jgi:UDP-N-acetyl-D-galactosamine dehydrogenase
MNELSMIFDKMDIDTKEVLEAAGTKWNFLKFFPGLVGGHCIGVDPYYLTYKAQKLGHVPQMILSGRKTNEDVPGFVAKRLTQYLIKAGKNPGDCKVLVMGLTFKEDVADIRNTKVIDVIKELQAYSIKVDLVDYWADKSEVAHEYNIDLKAQPDSDYDAVIVAVAHEKYKVLNSEYFVSIQKEKPILFDLKGLYQETDQMAYWRL